MAINVVVSWIFLLSGSLFLSLGGGVALWKFLRRRAYLALRQKRKLRKMDQARLAEAVKLKREMESLISSPGWKRLIDVAKTQMEGRTNSVLLAPTTNPYEQEYLKGEVQGMKTLVTIPEVIVADAMAIIDSTKEPDADLG